MAETTRSQGSRSESNESAKTSRRDRAGQCGCASVRRCCRNCQPTKILPSGCTMTASISKPLGAGLNESANPVVAIEPGDMIARLSADAGESCRPPRSCRLPGLRLSYTPLFAFGSNESAKPVVASSRAMRLRDCPPMSVKCRPPKSCRLAEPRWKGQHRSDVRVERGVELPSGFSRARRLRVTALRRWARAS